MGNAFAVANIGVTVELNDAQKKLLIDYVSHLAEAAHVYMEDNPLTPHQIGDLNEEIDKFKSNSLLYDSINIDPDTMTWTDLLGAWFFEKGGKENPKDHVWEFEFGPESKIAHDILTLPKVQEFIRDARAKIAKLKKANGQNWMWGGGNEGPFMYKVTFKVEDAIRTVKDLDAINGFLGSYKVEIQAGPGGGLQVTVLNDTGWESGTRFRKPAKLVKPNKGNQGVLEDRLRNGSGLHLGGTIRQRIFIYVPYE